MAKNLGTYYINVYPSMRGFANKVTAGAKGVSVPLDLKPDTGDLSRLSAQGVETSLDLDTSAAASDIASVASESNDIGRQAGTSFESSMSDSAEVVKSKLATLAKGAIGIFGAIGLGNLVSDAAEISDSSQKFAKTLDFASISSDEIDALSKSTRKYADETVYDLSDIQNTTAQLAANGVDNYDQLAEAAGNLNAVAGGNAETYKSVSMVLTQTAGAGKLTTENWNQLADAIPGASGKLQQAMKDNSAYTGNFRDAMAEGQITADEFNTAIMELGMSDVAAEAATSTSTFEGALGNLKATIEGGLADALTTLAPSITSLINALSEGSGPVLEGLNQVLAVTVDLFSKLPQPVQVATVGLGGFAIMAKALGGTPLKTLGNLAGSISKMGEKAGGLGTKLGDAAGGVTSMGKASGRSAGQIAAGALSIAALGEAVLMAGIGIKFIADGATEVAAQGTEAIVTFALMSGVLIGLVAVLSHVAPAATAGAVGLVALGAAILMIGAGIGVASWGLSLLAAQLPIVSEYGLSAAAGLVAMAGAALMMGAAGVVLLAGTVAAAAGLLVLSLGSVAALATMTLLAGVATLLAGTVALVAPNLIGMGNAVVQLATYSAMAAGGLTQLSGAAFSTAAGIMAASGPLAALGAAAQTAFASVSPLAGAFTAIMAAALLAATAATSMLAAFNLLPRVVTAGTSAFRMFARTAQSGARSAQSAIARACSNMARTVSHTRLRLPRIEVGALPHFTFNGSFNAKTGAVPTVDVRWYARGGIVNRATIFGAGEAGPEAIVPVTSRRMQPFSQAIADNLGGTGNVTNNVYIDGAIYNADDHVMDLMFALLAELNRIGALNNRGKVRA